MALKPPITLPLNTWLGALTALVVNTQIADTLTGASTNALLDLCHNTPVENGIGKAIISADLPAVEDYTEASSLLTIKKPTVSEEVLAISDYKKVQITLNDWFLRQSFESADASAMCAGYILSTMAKAKDIYIYRALVAKLEAYKPAKQGQTVSIAQIDADAAGLPSRDRIALKTLNADEIAVTINELMDNITAPSKAYNDLGYDEMTALSDLVLVINGKYKSRELVYAIATQPNGEKTQENRVPIVTIPSAQLSQANQTAVIGWLMHKEKLQYGYFYEVATNFYDASNLSQNNWLHFAYYLDTVSALPAVLLKATTAAAVNDMPVNVTNSTTNPVNTKAVS